MKNKAKSLFAVCLMSLLTLPVFAQQNETALTLPLSTGFEEADKIPVTFTGGAGYDEAYMCTGDRGVSIPSKAIVSIPGVPIQKGATYLFSCKLLGYDGYYNPFVYPPYAELYIAFGNKGYTRLNNSRSKVCTTVSQLLVADTTGLLSLDLQSGQGDQYYVDDIFLSMYTSPKAPGAVDSIVITPGEKGALKAALQWRNPSFDAGEAPLENLTGVVIDYCQDASFFSGVYTDTVLTQTPGALLTHEVELPHEGKWYFRFSCYNAEKSPMYALLQSGWIGPDPILAAPKNIRVTAEADGSAKITWDKLEAIGSNGGYLDGEVTGYTAIRMPLSGGKRDTVHTTKPACTFGPASLNLYTFSVYGTKDETEKGETATKTSVAGNTPDQIVAINATTQLYSDHSPLNIFKSLSSFIPGNCNNKASINQLIIDTSRLTAPCLIDSLILFVESSLTATVWQDYTIYLGYTDKQKTTAADFIPLGKLTKVFEGKITLNKGDRIAVIPHAPFFYDRTGNLVISVVRSKQAVNSTVNFYANSEMNARTQAWITSDTDFPVSTEALDGSFAPSSYEPVIILGTVTRTNTVKGSVKDINGNALDSISIAIRNKDQNTADFTYTIMTNENGEYAFEYLPDGEFTLTFSRLGLADVQKEIEVENQAEETIDITLYPSIKTTVSGIVADYNGKRIAGAEILFAGAVEYRTTSNDTGAFFSPDMYGSTTYRMSVMHPDFETGIADVAIEDRDVELDRIILDYIARPASRIAVRMNNEKLPEISWNTPYAIRNEKTGALNTMRNKNSIGFRGQEIMAAATFDSSEIAALKADRLVKVKFWAGDTTAVYTLKIFKGKNLDQEVHSQYIGKLQEGWFETFLDKPVTVEKEGVRVAVHVASGYHHKPVGYDEGPATENGSSLWVEGQWYDISYLGYYNGNWNIAAIFGETEKKPSANGYKLYRGKSTQLADPASYELIADNLKDTSYIDKGWTDLASGLYFYAVCADYYNGHISEPMRTGPIEKNMYHTVTFQLESDVEKDGRFCVFLDSKTQSYRQDTTNNRIVLQNVYHGTYALKAGKDGFSVYRGDLAVLKDTTVTVRVEENLDEPLWDNVSVNGNTVVLNWKTDDFQPFYDDMESYEDWSIDGYGDYILVGKQEKRTLSINGSSVLWPNQNTEQSFIVFNPQTTNPALTQENWQPHSGTKMLTAMFGAIRGNYDCLAKPVTGGGTIRFWTYGVTYDGKPETFRVLYSTEEEFIESSFKTLHTERQLESWPEWTLRQFELPEEARYFAVNYTSSDIFALHIDDISYEKDFVDALPTGYEIYLDNVLVTTVADSILSYTLDKVTNGEHTVGIKAVYASGTSEMIEKNVQTGPVSTENPEENEITVYQNTGTLHIEGEWTSAALYDLVGKRIGEIGRSSDTIDVSYLPGGVYLIAFKNTQNRITVKKVVIR